KCPLCRGPKKFPEEPELDEPEPELNPISLYDRILPMYSRYQNLTLIVFIVSPFIDVLIFIAVWPFDIRCQGATGSYGSLFAHGLVAIIIVTIKLIETMSICVVA